MRYMSTVDIVLWYILMVKYTGTSIQLRFLKRKKGKRSCISKAMLRGGNWTISRDSAKIFSLESVKSKLGVSKWSKFGSLLENLGGDTPP